MILKMTKAERANQRVIDLQNAWEDAYKMLKFTNKKCWQTLCDKLEAKILLAIQASNKINKDEVQ